MAHFHTKVPCMACFLTKMSHVACFLTKICPVASFLTKMATNPTAVIKQLAVTVNVRQGVDGSWGRPLKAKVDNCGVFFFGMLFTQCSINLLSP